LKRYVASLYRLEPAVWERVADFIELCSSPQPPTSDL
jgi:hypothetical protein